MNTATLRASLQETSDTLLRAMTGHHIPTEITRGVLTRARLALGDETELDRIEAAEKLRRDQYVRRVRVYAGIFWILATVVAIRNYAACMPGI